MTYDPAKASVAQVDYCKKTCIQTHRCNGSLKAHVSVRQIHDWHSKDPYWAIRTPVPDPDSFCTYLSIFGANDIKYCPYCGVELNGE